MKKIAIILPDLRGGGVEKTRIRFAQYFIDKGYKVDFVLLRNKGELISIIPSGVSIFSLEVKSFKSAFLPLVDYLNKNKPDAVLGAMWPLTIVVILAVKFAKIKARVVVSDHNEMDPERIAQGMFERSILPLSILIIYRMADGVIVPSADIRERISKLGKLNKKKIHIIYNGVYNTEIKNQINKYNVDNCNINPTLIAIGSINEQKDYPTLLNALKIVLLQKKVKLLILGDGKKRADIERLICKLELNDYVDLKGFVDNPFPFILESDLFVLSSKSEGFGNVIVEALACGTPVVSTDCNSGPREILEDGRYGELVPVGNPQALASGILKALKNNHDKKRLKRRAKFFSVEKAADQYLGLLFPYYLK